MKMRFATWSIAEWNNQPYTFTNLFPQPSMLRVIETSAAINRKITPWAPPKDDCFKFNADGASSGNPGPARIGGVLRDSRGAIKAIFSKSVEICDCNKVKFLAIKEAMLIFAALEWVNNHDLIIKSDSYNAYNWCRKPEDTFWKLRKIVLQLEVMKKRLKSWDIIKIYRESNS